MPCKICNHLLLRIDDDKLTCPQCESLRVVPYEDSLKITDHFISYLNGLIENELKKYTRLSIITNAFWEREKLIRNFQEHYTVINLELLFSCNLLIRRLIKMNGFSDKEESTSEKIIKLIDTYGVFSRVEEFRQRLEAKTWSLLYMKKYDLANLNSLSLEDVHFCPNEYYDRVTQTLSKYNIMSEEKAEEKMKVWKQDFNPSVKKFNRYLSPRETISIFYEMISMFYVAFFRNKVYFEAFGLPDFSKFNIKPILIKKIVESYPLHNNALTAAKLDEFTRLLITKLGGRYKQFFEYFVISENNPNAIPLFLQINDLIFISQSYANLYHYVLVALIHKEEFDDETKKRSKIFESNIVKEYFEKNNYRYICDYKKKGKLQIDGIAISDSNVYVIEVKGWGSKRLIEERTSKEIIDRDIKNAVDGFHYVHKTSKNKKTVSLPKKVNWVKEHKMEFGISENADIVGMLVINESPTLSEYNGCKIMFIDDFEYIKSGIRRS
ncbi:MAG: NERD domain-containing protein [Nitrosarchaeum sp.]|nr:NERD domain-containing protein [Nitrosarchaeum sp.]